MFFMQPAPAPLAPPRPRRGICFLETSHVKQPTSFRASLRARESINKLRSGKKLWIATVVALPRNDMELLINFLSKNLHYLETMPVKKQCHSERARERGNPLTNFVLEKLWIAMQTAFARNDIGLVYFGFPD